MNTKTQNLYQYTATLEKVVDGDTCECLISLGFGAQLQGVEFRFSSINAPEKQTPLGQAAIARVNQWFAVNPVFMVTSVKVKRPGLDKKERYGRYLGTFSPLAGGVSLNQILVDEGLAKPYNGRGKKPE